MLTEADLFPGPKELFWKMTKGSILYVEGKKPGPCTNIWRGKVVQVIHRKTGVSTDGSNNVMLLRQMW